MFGDDSDPTVMSERVGSGRSFGHVREGAASWQERLGGHGQEGSENPIGLGTVNESKGNAATMNGCKFYENKCRCKAHDAMMKCNNNTNKTHDGHAKHGRHMERRSWGVTTLHHYERISSRDLG